MNRLTHTQQSLLMDYAQFIKGQNSRKAHFILRACGGVTILASLMYTSVFGIALGIFLLGVSFLGNLQAKFVEAAIAVAKKPSHIRSINIEIKTSLWENNTRFHVMIEAENSRRYQIDFIPLTGAPSVGNHIATAYYQENAKLPALIVLDDFIVIPSAAPKPV